MNFSNMYMPGTNKWMEYYKNLAEGKQIPTILLAALVRWEHFRSC